MSRFLIHMNTKESVVRFYDKSKGATGKEAFDNRAAYDVELILDWLTPSLVFVSSLMSRVDLRAQDFADFKAYAKTQGIKTILQEVNGVLEVEHL